MIEKKKRKRVEKWAETCCPRENDSDFDAQVAQSGFAEDC
jgi:hypothetical protein